MRKIISIFIASVFLISSCGGDEDNLVPHERKTSLIRGMVFNGAISGSNISVWEFKKGALGRKLGQTSSDASGQYQLSVISSGMPILIKAEGGAYLDPHTQNVVTLSNGKTFFLSSMSNLIEGSEHDIMLTPLTHMSAGFAQYKINQGEEAAHAIKNALSTVNSMYGFDVNSTKPIDITKGGHSSYASDGHLYGAILTAFSSYAADLIKKYPSEESALLYTSIYLSDIQYEDTLSDGVLNGFGINSVGIEKKLSFGVEAVTGDMYAWRIAQHLLIAVNNPDINRSQTDPIDYLSLANQINEFGTNAGVESLVTLRDVKELDKNAPKIERIDNAVLVGEGRLNLKLTDEIGVKDFNVSLQYQTINTSQEEGTWSIPEPCEPLFIQEGEIEEGFIEEMQIQENQTEQTLLCRLDKSMFMAGLRQSQADVLINTVALDNRAQAQNPFDLENTPKVTFARLVIHAEDVLGNNALLSDPTPKEIPFIWDNTQPVIEVLSSKTINAGEMSYPLCGTVSDLSEITQVSITKDGEIRYPECSKTKKCNENDALDNKKCTFSEIYDASLFGNSTSFLIKAIDNKNNEGHKQYEVTKDNTPPTQRIEYPDSTMTFIDNKTGLESNDDYAQYTFTEENMAANSKQLKVNYDYASRGLKAVHSDGPYKVVFSDLNVTILNKHKIPYLSVTLSDPSDNALASPIEKLELSVSYWVKPPKSPDYAFIQTVKSQAHQKQTSSKGSSKNAIPHKAFTAQDPEITYYIPYVKELLGSSYANLAPGSEQKIVIKTKDSAGNSSNEQSVFFKTTFALPTFEVITPFINAHVQLSRLNEQGNDFDVLNHCVTQPINEQRDVAGCQITSSSDSAFFRINLSSLTNNPAYYYQWSNEESKKSTVNLNQAHFGAYFSANNNTPIFITELSAYHTGLFDYLFYSKNNRSLATATNTLSQVNKALEGGRSFFQFDPIKTRYARHSEKPFTPPPYMDDGYRHRFILESLLKLSENEGIYNSVDFAAAFYQDLMHDGIADGKGENKNPIYIGPYSLSESTYRKQLGQLFFDLLIGEYGYAPEIALPYADILAKANPSIDKGLATGPHYVFDVKNPPESIDKSPPQILVLANEVQAHGASYLKNKMYYIKGKVDFTVMITDPSGIKEKPKLTIKGKSAEGTQDHHYPPVNELPGGTNFKKTYAFTLDSTDENLKDIKQFSLRILASDNNEYAHTDKNPHETLFTVDNDVPHVEAIPPEGSTSESFHNINKPRTFIFKITDAVDDVLDKRTLVFSKDASEPLTFTSDMFQNTKNTLALTLCVGSDCPENTQKMADGIWRVEAFAVDNLGNQRKKLTKESGSFEIKIDATAPIVQSNTTGPIVGRDFTWKPESLLSSSTGSPLKHINVWHVAPNGVESALLECGAENTELACIEGSQPKMKVRFIRENAGNQGGEHQLIVQATDNATPPNISNKGTYNLTLDVEGPILVPATPWALDTLSNTGFVLGKSFSVHITSVTDVSGVESLALYQMKDTQEILIKEEHFTSPLTSPYSMIVSEDDAKKIRFSDDTKSEILTFILKAKDKNKEEASRSLTPMRLDKKGPTLALNHFDASAYYYALDGYSFALKATDFDGTSLYKESDAGVNKDSVGYWTYRKEGEPTGSATPPSDDAKRTLVLRANEDSTLKVKASNVRGIESEQTFDIKVDNAPPILALISSVYAEDKSPIINGNVHTPGDIEVRFSAKDISGLRSPTARYTFENEPEKNLALEGIEGNVENDGAWLIKLNAAMLEKEGRYQITFEVEDKVRYQESTNPNKTTERYTLNVQRKGIVLESVFTPPHFGQYASPQRLSVTFKHTGEAKLTALECWIRENWIEQSAPQEDELPYKKEFPHAPPYRCTLTGIKSIPSGATLITRTTSENKVQDIQIHRFASLDAKGPVVVTPARYELTENDVERDKSGALQLTVPIEITDDLSGLVVDISKSKPTLKKGRQSYPPSSCDTNTKSNKTTCFFKAPYARLTPPTGENEHPIVISNLEDNAGNTSTQHSLSLVVPTGNLALKITHPLDGSAINTEKLNVEFRYQTYKNSSVDEYIATVNGTSFSSLEEHNANKFKPQKPCEDEMAWTCSAFTYEWPHSLEDKNPLSIEIKIVDAWGKEKRETITLKIDKMFPTLTKMTLEPKHAKPGEKIALTAHFSEKVSQPKGALLDQPVIWTQQENAPLFSHSWKGNVTVPNVEDHISTLKFTFTDFADNAGNVGENGDAGDTNENNTLPLSPEITIIPIENVNSAQAINLEVTGLSKRFLSGKNTLTLLFTDKAKTTLSVTGVKLAADGKWSTSTDISALAEGRITLTVFGSNEQGIHAEKNTTFTLATQPPEVKNLHIEGTLNQGKKSKVTLTFSAPVKGVSAFLGSEAVEFEGPLLEYKATWSGHVIPVLEADKSTLPLRIERGFINEAGNVGEEKTQEFAVKPVLTLHSLSKVFNADEAQNLLFSGSGLGFNIGDKIQVSLQSKNDPEQNINLEARFTQGGLWQILNVDISTWASSPISVAVSGKNAQGNTAETIKGSFTLDTKKPEMNEVHLEPKHARSGEEVTLTAHFSEEVSQPKGAFLDNAIIWKSQKNASPFGHVWKGKVIVPKVEDNIATFPFTLRDFADEAGNVGLTKGNNALPLTPDINIHPIENVNSAQTINLEVTGLSKRFLSGKNTLTLLFTDKAKTTLSVTGVKLAADGKWSTSTDISALAEGRITLTVFGSNEQGIHAEKNTTFTLATQPPEVKNLHIEGTLNQGKKSKVTLTFSAPVKGVSAFLGSEAVEFEGPLLEYKATWSGHVIPVLEADKSTLPLRIERGFINEAGNVGEEKTQEFAVKPLLKLDPHLPLINFNEASHLTFSGHGFGFDIGDKIQLTLQSRLPEQNLNLEATFSKGGLWRTPFANISHWSSSQISVVLSGENGQGNTAEKFHSSFILKKE